MSETITTERDPVDQLDEPQGGAQAAPAHENNAATPPAAASA